MKTIPIVDLHAAAAAPGPEVKQRVAKDLYQALTTTGFAYIVGHGIDQQCIDAAFEASREFHASPLERKQSIAINDFHRGYMGMATSTIVTSSVATVRKPNLSESLMLMHELAPDDPDLLAGKPMQGPNQWPDWMPGFRPVIEAYIAEVDLVARRIVHTIALALDLPEHALVLRLLASPLRGVGQSALPRPIGSATSAGPWRLVRSRPGRVGSRVESRA
jgi:isopenicillin N synthase-like dioxygenase